MASASVSVSTMTLPWADWLTGDCAQQVPAELSAMRKAIVRRKVSMGWVAEALVLQSLCQHHELFLVTRHQGLAFLPPNESHTVSLKRGIKPSRKWEGQTRKNSLPIRRDFGVKPAG